MFYTLKSRATSGTFISAIISSRNPLFTSCYTFHRPQNDGSMCRAREFRVRELNPDRRRQRRVCYHSANCSNSFIHDIHMYGINAYSLYSPSVNRKYWLITYRGDFAEIWIVGWRSELWRTRSVSCYLEIRRRGWPFDWMRRLRAVWSIRWYLHRGFMSEWLHGIARRLS